MTQSDIRARRALSVPRLAIRERRPTEHGGLRGCSEPKSKLIQGELLPDEWGCSVVFQNLASSGALMEEIRKASAISEMGEADRYQLLVDAVVDYAIYMLDLEGRVVSWNSGGVRLKGYTAGEIIGQSFSRFYTPEDQKAGAPQRALRTARETGRFHADGWRVRKDGTRFWASVVIDAIRNEDGELLGFAKITRDVTERQLATQTLLDGESRYRRLIEAVVDYAIFQLDANGLIATWNPGAQRIKGYTEPEIIGKHLSTFYTEEDKKAGVPHRALETAAKTGKYEAEGWRVRKGGSTFWASVVIDAIRDEVGNLIGFAKVTRDITERTSRPIKSFKPSKNISHLRKKWRRSVN